MVDFFSLLVGFRAYKAGGRCEWGKREILYAYPFFAMKTIDRKTKARGMRGPEEYSCSLSCLPNVLIIACHWRKATY